jgi:hypothetical protein
VTPRTTPSFVKLPLGAYFPISQWALPPCHQVPNSIVATYVSHMGSGLSPNSLSPTPGSCYL